MGDWDRKAFMKEALEAERFGPLAVRTVFFNALEKLRHDPENMAYLAVLCDEKSWDHWEHPNLDLMGTYQFLYDWVRYCARTILSAEDYHCFCELMWERGQCL